MANENFSDNKSRVKVCNWNAEKGYGFASRNGKNYFVHKSALGMVSRNPQVGDEILVLQCQETPKGPRISKGTLVGVPLKQGVKKHSAYIPGYYRKRKWKACLILLALAALLALFQCVERSFGEKTVKNSAWEFSNQKYDEKVRDESQFKCDERKYCGQMNSFEEALFFLKNCPGVLMDGDGDGIPCEKQFGK